MCLVLAREYFPNGPLVRFEFVSGTRLNMSQISQDLPLCEVKTVDFVESILDFKFLSRDLAKYSGHPSPTASTRS